jgi:hypothetical protein
MPFDLGGLGKASEVVGNIAKAAAEGTQAAINELNSTLALLQEVGYEISNLKIENGTPIKCTVQMKFSRPVTDQQLDAIKEKHTGVGVAAVISALHAVNQLRDAVKVGKLDMGEIEVVMGTPPRVVASWKAREAASAASTAN